MIDKLKQTIQQAGGSLMGHAVSLGDAAVAKGNSIIDEWVAIIPKMEQYGLSTTYFSVGVSLSPVLEVELRGKSETYSVDRLKEILEEVKGNTPMTFVFNAMKTTAQLYNRAGLTITEPLTVRLRVRLSPEIKVSYGVPICE